jgi:hypothetical protein
MLHGNIQYLRRSEIDTKKWDRCIDNANNCLVYGYSFYLDHMAKHWDALVLGDYEVVMPLVWRKKFGIYYLYQPAFTQQLGIFTGAALTEELVNYFLRTIPSHFRFAEIFLNYAHPEQALPQRTNFVLPLHTSYKQLRGQYKDVLVKNLKRASRYNLSYSDEADYRMVLAGYKELYGSRIPHVTDEDYSRFSALCSFLFKGNMVVRAIKEDNQLLSAALFLHHKNRLYLLASVTWPEGRSREANRFLLDRVINEFAASDTVLDFEGSDLPGVALFFNNFGGINEPYYFYRYNKLPWPISLLK